MRFAMSEPFTIRGWQNVRSGDDARVIGSAIEKTKVQID
jgi:hypothetical protein